MTVAAFVTMEQMNWMRLHPEYQRTSHIRGKFRQRGTLKPDGTFVPDAPGAPVIDGNGFFGVGVPIVAKKRR